MRILLGGGGSPHSVYLVSNTIMQDSEQTEVIKKILSCFCLSLPMTPVMVSFHVMAEVFTMATALGAVTLASAVFPSHPSATAFSKLGFC